MIIVTYILLKRNTYFTFLGVIKGVNHVTR